MVLEDEALAVGSVTDLRLDKTLNEIIVDDLEYGVGGRPSLPSCFDDDDEVLSGNVDYRADIKYNAWDVMSAKCVPVNRESSDNSLQSVEASATEKSEAE